MGQSKSRDTGVSCAVGAVGVIGTGPYSECVDDLSHAVAVLDSSMRMKKYLDEVNLWLKSGTSEELYQTRVEPAWLAMTKGEQIQCELPFPAKPRPEKNSE